ncbi:TetR/AcrR family transcriptional regulator [Phreatobacter sp. AB_2022a]|uniref:TetR/AcrR family transcriptional regulator n=1 Tax=Phreatobacter sp. AB_2022a TaxID=3003134 RepID=UPI002286E3B3|nr:TetR/AcrR family transcriptional regulator [Phreatobacter sp. AB_2022a]MCZ0737015.1 TetR/AcrR family transcriptional regulator [Phreatobacter sp. AB_2022a]
MTDCRNSPPAASGPERRPSYHHGTLQAALIEATDAILMESGIEGFTLRAAARRAGVSPAAPAHHFGSAAGLLTEVAIRGNEDLASALLADAPADADPTNALRAMGVAYVRFAMTYPGHFKLMYRKDLLLESEALHNAAHVSLELVELHVQRYLGRTPGTPLDRSAEALVLGCWSSAHGFAQLAIEGRLAEKAGPMDMAAYVDAIVPEVMAMLLPARPVGGT